MSLPHVPHNEERVEYVGQDDAESYVWQGHPGLVMDGEAIPDEVTVAFVAGPTLTLGPDQVRRLSRREYDDRRARMRRGFHPLEDRSVPWLTEFTDEL